MKIFKKEKVDIKEIAAEIMKIILATPVKKVDREKFLTDALTGKVEPDVLKEAIAKGTQDAGVSLNIIQDEARKCIKKVKAISSAESAVTGIPGGVAGISVGILADIAQFFGNLGVLIQKLLYLYGAKDLSILNDKHFKSVIMLFMGIAFGLRGFENIAKILLKILQEDWEKQAKKLFLLTKPFLYSAAKKVAKMVGFKLSKKLWAKIAAKSVMVIGAGISGTLNWITFTHAANKLLVFLNKEYNKPLGENLQDVIESIKNGIYKEDIPEEDEKDIDYDNLEWDL